jgi:hypothetical protein
MCPLGRDLRWSYYSVSLIVDPCDPDRLEKIARDRARPVYQEALAAWAEHWLECDECRQEE